MNGHVNPRPSHGQTAGHAQQKRLRLKLRNRVSNDDVFDVEAREVKRRRPLLVVKTTPVPAPESSPLTAEQLEFLEFRRGKPVTNFQVQWSAARSMSFKGKLAAVRILGLALASIGNKTRITPDGLLFQETLANICREIGKDRLADGGTRRHEALRQKRQFEGKKHPKRHQLFYTPEVLRKVITDDVPELRLVLVQRNAAGRWREKAFALWDGYDVPTRVESGDEGLVSIRFHPRVLELLQLSRRGYTSIFLRELNRVDNIRQVTMLMQLSARRGFKNNRKSDAPEGFHMQREEVRLLFDFNKDAVFRDVWEALERVKTGVQSNTRWRYRMKRRKRGNLVEGIDFEITQTDRNLLSREARKLISKARRAEATLQNRAPSRASRAVPPKPREKASVGDYQRPIIDEVPDDAFG